MQIVCVKKEQKNGGKKELMECIQSYIYFDHDAFLFHINKFAFHHLKMVYVLHHTQFKQWLTGCTKIKFPSLTLLLNNR